MVQKIVTAALITAALATAACNTVRGAAARRELGRELHREHDGRAGTC